MTIGEMRKDLYIFTILNRGYFFNQDDLAEMTDKKIKEEYEYCLGMINNMKGQWGEKWSLEFVGLPKRNMNFE